MKWRRRQGVIIASAPALIGACAWTINAITRARASRALAYHISPAHASPSASFIDAPSHNVLKARKCVGGDIRRSSNGGSLVNTPPR